ncbi:ATP-binding cassette domain-containing protein [Agrobacterium burrii]|uniref:ATP-binding cassette domain-containing protein n=1 Tax=Agrobacterium burrii TaxID=2815339 RepID=A0ABS3EJT3_9HYPH|nr:ATP-binding cassette domain-containing protein [Agrobacterium burrii]MBO0132257.1 ATP-binding cassette domain-containing protein [Agrobacterium burrii]
MSNIILKAEGVAMHFGGVKALDGVNFHLREGELRCLIGPNGAGKTTFFRCLTGTQKPTFGAITFDGIDVGGRERHEIAAAGIGIKTQIPSLFDGLSVHENLWLSLRAEKNLKERERRIDEVLARVGVSDLRHHVLGRMAHGQRQLVELAMVVASDPKLVLLDEPAAGMTGAEVDRLASIIKDLNRSHTVVVVEHDMQFIRMIADQVTVFHQGKILLEGGVESVLSNQAVRDVYLGKKHAA